MATQNNPAALAWALAIGAEARVTDELEREVRAMERSYKDKIEEAFEAEALEIACRYAADADARIAELEQQLATATERERERREICSGIVQREWDAYLLENGAFLPACDYCRSARTYGHTADCLIGRLAAALAASETGGE